MRYQDGNDGRKRSAWALAGFAAAVTVAAMGGALFTPRKGRVKEWYDALDKPPFNPPKWVFPVAWTTLYPMIAWSGYRVWQRPGSPERSRALGLWAAQMALNGAWTPAFFGTEKPEAGLADISLLLPSIAAYALQARKVDRAAAKLMVPYLGWVTFATILNTEIVRRNPGGVPQGSRALPEPAPARAEAFAPEAELAAAV